MFEAKAYWILKRGKFALALPGNEDDGWIVRLRIGWNEYDSSKRYVRRRDAERAAKAVWQALFGDLT